jgi:hypothetical protein
VSEISRGRRGQAQREREEGSQIDDNLHHLPSVYSGSGAQQWQKKLVSMAASVCSERGSK